MHNSKMQWFRAIIFIVVFILINQVLIFALCPKKDYSRNALREMYSEKQNINLAFIGSSYSRRIDPYIMDKELGCNTFDYAFGGQTYIGTYSCLKELFKYHKPKMVVLTTDIDNYISKEEQPNSYISTSLYLKSFWIKLEYYLNSAEYGSYLKRLFKWPSYHISSLAELTENMKGKRSEDYLNYPQQEQMDDYISKYNEKKEGYMGKGFLRYNKAVDDNKLGAVEKKHTNLNDINATNIEYFKKIVDLCNENNSELILLHAPIPTYKIFSWENYFVFNEEIEKIAKESSIDYYNYNLIKPELFKVKTSYFEDGFHLNREGSEVFSKSLAEFLNKRSTGEDMSKYFYTPDEYYQSIDYINNTWFTFKNNKNTISLKADSFQGPNIVPEYQFVLKNSDTGKEEVIRDYGTETEFEFKLPSSNKYSVRVNARPVGSKEKFTRYYQQEIKK